MRLIDADALLEHKFLTPQVKVIGGRHNGKVKEQIIESYQKGWNDAIDAIVDNAPTVLHDNYSEGYQDGVKKVLSEKPQGEWIEDSIYEGYRKCSNCNSDAEWLDGGGQFLPNFCPNCGADMRGDSL